MKKRFIAGATCPQCETVDTVFTLDVDGEISRHCSRCDFTEKLQALDAEQEMIQAAAISEWQPVKVLE